MSDETRRLRQQTRVVAGARASSSPYGPPWTENWISYRHSLVVVFTREDAGETVLTCADCGCEVDVKPQPHSPTCSTLVSA